MSVQRPSHEEASKALSRACHHSCRTCTRPCTADSGYNHRFDCCGVVVAHVLDERMNRVIVNNPTNAGYLTGPSKTGAPA